MMKIQTIALVVLAFAPWTAGCGSSQVGGEKSSVSEFAPASAAKGGPALIRGVAIDAASGQPLEGVRVVAPDGVEVVSDAHGFFEIRGLTVGTTGELVASTADGRSGSNRLRPLRSGTLEIVVFVR